MREKPAACLSSVYGEGAKARAGGTVLDNGGTNRAPAGALYTNGQDNCRYLRKGKGLSCQSDSFTVL